MKNMVRSGQLTGILLLLCTAVSLIIANTSAGAVYAGFWNIHIPYTGALHLPHTIVHFVNDGLMAIFFFNAGLEIRHELLFGGLSSVKKALLPGAAAVGGMLFPAAIFLLINKGTAYNPGWAIPMATDIAFSLGIASLTGRRFSRPMRIFLTALAIIDDLGAIVVIAAFYGGTISTTWLLISLGVLLIMALCSRLKVQHSVVFILLTIILWYCLFNSGLHATIAGVIGAFFLPVEKLKKAEHHLLLPVNLFIVPVFALANTVIVLPAELLSFLSTGLTWGIVLGLIAGKLAGITGTTWLLTKMKLAELPAGFRLANMIGIGLLAGIGFTMSLFISVLSFDNVTIQENAKLAVLTASLLAMLLSYGWIRIMCKPANS
jgi:Na+:H+ antiporter, NhaA family